MSTPTIEAGRDLRLAVAPITRVQVRDATQTGDGHSWTIEGYAAVFEQATVLYDGKWFRIREELARGAFDGVMQRVASGDELVHLNHGHDMSSAVAASNVRASGGSQLPIGGLELNVDDHGLRFFARVDAEDPDAVRMAAKMRRGVVGQASFAFRIGEESLTVRELDDGRDDELYRIEEVSALYDVCVCAQGAYPQTESYIRSLAAASLRVPDLGAHGRSDLDSEGHGSRSGSDPEGTDTHEVAPPAGPVSHLSLLRAQARASSRSLRMEGAL